MQLAEYLHLNGCTWGGIPISYDDDDDTTSCTRENLLASTEYYALLPMNYEYLESFS